MAMSVEVGQVNPNSPDWIDGYRTAEAEYVAGHGSLHDERDSALALLSGLAEAASMNFLADDPDDWPKLNAALTKARERLK